MKLVIDLDDRSKTRRALVIATAVLRAQVAEDDDMSEELGALVYLKRQLLKAPTVEEYEREAVTTDTWRGVRIYPNVQLNSVGMVRDATTLVPLAVFPPEGSIGSYVKLKDREGAEHAVMINWLVERAFGIQLSNI